MIQIAVCDDNIDELSNMAQLINQYRLSKHLNCEYALFTNGFELAFALESYSVKAINYVLKPVSKEKLFFTFDEILEHIKMEKNDNVVIVKSNEGIQKILISNLIFAEVICRNILYHTFSGKVITCTEPFSAVCNNLLKYGHFVKTHRSYIVNMQYIDTITNHQVTLQTLASVPIAQGKAREIKQEYLAYQMENV